MQKKQYEAPSITFTCERSHIESIDKPGHCLWCDQPIGELAPVSDDDMRAALVDFLQPDPPADPALVADAFHELTRSVSPELAIILKAVAYGGAFFIVTGTFGYRGTLRSGSRRAEVQDLQLSKCIMDLAAAWERA